MKLFCDEQWLHVALCKQCKHLSVRADPDRSQAYIQPVSGRGYCEASYLALDVSMPHRLARSVVYTVPVSRGLAGGQIDTVPCSQGHDSAVWCSVSDGTATGQCSAHPHSLYSVRGGTAREGPLRAHLRRSAAWRCLALPARRVGHKDSGQHKKVLIAAASQCQCVKSGGKVLEYVCQSLPLESQKAKYQGLS